MSAKTPAQIDGNDSAKKIVLLAEDDASMRRFLEVVLKKAGYKVISAEDGLIAMKLALENDIDAIVADAVMPNLTGYDLCRMIRQNFENKHIPFIILSGLNIEDSEDSKDFRADAYLLKNENLKELLIAALTKLFETSTNS